MCEPVSMTMAALSVGSTALGIQGQRRMAKAQFAVNAEQRRRQNQQIADAASVRAGNRVQQMRAERARLRVAAGEANVAGNSFLAQLNDATFQASQDVALIGKDAENQDLASETRFLGANARVRNPSALESGLALANAAYSGYSAGADLRARVDKLKIPSGG